MSVEVTCTPADSSAVAAINARVPGWSGNAHHLFFKAVLAAVPPVRRLLMLGVYHGRDLSYVLDILARYHPEREIEIVGVDRFTPDPCADWTPAKGPRTWESEVHAPPPSLAAAKANTADRRVTLIATDDFAFLAATQLKFDAVYLDTAHDYDTVARQLRQVRHVANPGAIICGDDYSDRHTWGVKTAVTEAFGEKHRVIAGWIWHARIEDLKS